MCGFRLQYWCQSAAAAHVECMSITRGARNRRRSQPPYLPPARAEAHAPFCTPQAELLGLVIGNGRCLAQRIVCAANARVLCSPRSADLQAGGAHTSIVCTTPLARTRAALALGRDRRREEQLTIWWLLVDVTFIFLLPRMRMISNRHQTVLRPSEQTVTTVAGLSVPTILIGLAVAGPTAVRGEVVQGPATNDWLEARETTGRVFRCIATGT